MKSVTVGARLLSRNRLVLGGSRWKSTATAAVDKTSNYVELKHVPSLPFIGSTLSAYSGVSFDLNRLMDTWPAARAKFGDFYTIGLPGRGSDISGTIHIVQDPQEMMKVLRAEGKYPSSSIEDLWTFKQLQDDYNFGRAGEIMGHGPDWKRVRSFMQTDLLAPKSANRYLPGILETTKFISKGMPAHAGEMNHFLQLASFDMFCSVLLGAFPRITDPDTTVDPQDAEFCKNVASVLSLGSGMTLSTWENILHKLGIRSANYKKLYKDWCAALEYGKIQLQKLENKKEAGTLSPAEEASYWNQAMERWKLGETDLTKDEVNRICLTMFNASVDTTSAKTAWHFLHLALNPEAQEKLYQEIRANVQETGGKITPALFSASNSPYLGAVVRESNRLTCPANLAPMRKIAAEVEIHGHMIPKGSVVGFDQASKSIDPEFIDGDPFAFHPERFLPDAVAKRKGTKSEFLDHPLFSGPFGQGARRCPGSRVARNESMALIAQCVLDWKMTLPGYNHYQDVPYALETLVTPQLPTFQFEARE